MTRRDSVLIAASIKTAADRHPKRSPEWRAIRESAIAIAHACKADNPLFKFEEFYKAAGVHCDD